MAVRGIEYPGMILIHIPNRVSSTHTIL